MAFVCMPLSPQFIRSVYIRQRLAVGDVCTSDLIRLAHWGVVVGGTTYLAKCMVGACPLTAHMQLGGAGDLTALTTAHLTCC